MKIRLLFSVLFLFADLAAADEEPAGRYQIVSSIIEITGKGATTQQHIILRIDTKTGRTWEYIAGVGKDGKMFEGWVPIPDKTLTGE